MKNLSNIKSALAVSMLLSASLFSMETSCGCKLAGEILRENAAQRTNLGGSASVYQRQYDDFQQAPAPSKGIIVIGGHEKKDGIIIETGKDGIVVQGGIKDARINLDYFVALDDALRARRVEEYAAFDQYNAQRLKNKLVSEFFDVSCPKARAKFVEGLSEGKRKVLFAEIRQTEINASHDEEVIKARNSIARQSRDIYLLKAEESLLDRAEKENSSRMAIQEVQLKEKTHQLLTDLQRYPDHNLVVNDPCGEKTKTRSGFKVTAFAKSKEFSVDAFEAELTKAINSDRWGKREDYHATLKMRIAEIRETESQISVLSKRQADLTSQKSKVRKELCRLEKEKGCAETHMTHAVIYSAKKSLELKQLNTTDIEYNDLMESKKVPYSHATEKSLYAHTVTGLVSYAEKSVDTGKLVFLQNLRRSEELSLRADHASARAGFEAAIRETSAVDVRRARVDLIAAQVDSMKPEDASVFLGREIAHLESDLSGHKKHDDTVHAAMGKKAPAAPQGLLARLCFWK